MKTKIIIAFGIIGLFTASCEAVFVENISNSTVVLLAPTDASTVTAGTVIFSWETVADADSYQVQISTPTFVNASQVVLDTIVTNKQFTKELVAGDFQWRVKALNSDYETNYSTHTFIVN